MLEADPSFCYVYHPCKKLCVVSSLSSFILKTIAKPGGKKMEETSTSNTAVVSSSSTSTSNLTRSYTSLDASRFTLFAFSLAAVRTTLMHPLTVVLTTVRSSSTTPPLSVKQEFLRFKSNYRYFLTGLPVFVFGTAFSESIYLLYFEYMRESSSSSSPLASLFSVFSNLSQDSKDFLSGFVADSLRQTLIIPFSVIATTQIINKRFFFASDEKMKHPVSLSQVVTKLNQSSSNGRAFFAGLGTSLSIGPLWTASWWWLYAKSKRVLYEKTKDLQLFSSTTSSSSKNDNWLLFSEDDNVFVNTAASIFASATAAAVFNPFLVVRTRLMARQHGEKTNVRVILKDLFSLGNKFSVSNGFRMLTAGTLATMGFSVIEGIGMSMTYEYAKAWAEQRKHKNQQ